MANSRPERFGGAKVKWRPASGSTAQENAIEQFVYAYIRACPGYTLDYNANGSGAGVQQFVDNETDLAGSDKPLDSAKGEPDRAHDKGRLPDDRGFSPRDQRLAHKILEEILRVFRSHASIVM